MALNKRKVLDAARKYAQKGAKEKALKEYGKLLKEDSRDAKLLLEIGDAHRRWGQNEEAISHYTKVAEQYKQGGFDARAVAVFKQIINLDDKRYGAYVSLADLYQRMGLDTEAANALQTAADGYHKEGQKSEALELLRKMATLDPSSTTSRMKVADLLRQEDMLDDAVSEYEAVAEELVRQGATDQLIPVYERVLEVRPDRDDVSFALARALVQLSDASRAEPYARRAFDAKPDAEGYFDLLNGIYTELDKTEELADVTRHMAQVFRGQGDEDRARELMQRLPGDDALSLDDESEGAGGDAFDAAVGDSLGGSAGDEELLDDDFLDDDSFIDISDDDALELDVQADDEGVVLNGPVIDDPADDDDAEGLPEGDPDQLFAEASVYLRYGKRDQAIVSLEAILAQEPRHRDALEKLGECYADAGDAPRAVDYWKQAADLAANAHDEAALDVLRERIAVLDPDAAADLAQPPAAAAAGETGVVDMDDEIELADFDPDDVAASEPLPERSATAAASIDTQKVAEDLEEAEFYMAQELFDEAAAIYERILESCPNHPSAMVRLGELQAARGEDPGASASVVDDAAELTLDSSELSFEEDDTAGVEAPGEAEVSAGEIEVDLDLDADVEVDTDDEDVTSAGSREGVELSEESLGSDEEEDVNALFDSPPSLSEEDLGEEVAVDGGAEIEVSIELDDGDDEPLELADEGASVSEAAADHTAADNTMPLVQADGLDADDPEEADDEDVEIDVAAEAEDEAIAADAAQEDDDDSFDLAAELRESLEDGAEVDAAESAEHTCEEEGFASIFKDFKSGVEKALGEGDYETRFDLGIAYRGMELFDDALGEFRICLDSPGYRLESLHMMGLCAFDLGRFSDATNHLEQALASEDVPEQQQAGLRFDLGRAFEGAEDFPRAKEAFEGARAIDDSIPTIDDCIERVSARIEGDDQEGVELAEASATQGDGGFENFDDLMAEVQAEDAPEAETFEAFDDVVAEVEAEEAVIETVEPIEDDDDDVEVAETVSLADVDPNQSGDTTAEEDGGGDKPKKRKRKRISFV